MRFREALQVRLRERYRRLYKSDENTYDDNVRYFLAWGDDIPAIASVFGAISRSERDLDPAQWWNGPRESPNVKWPETEIGRAKVALWALRHVGAGEEEAWRLAHKVVLERGSISDILRDFTSSVVEPLIEYVEERLASESDVLYVLERYRRRVAWFEQQRLWDAYQADTAKGEESYDTDLRRFLFDQGIDHPFSQPEGPSGKADVVADLDTDDPLVCEVKLFDGDSYGVPYLAKGYHQALRYADDHGKTEAHLVVFNLSDQRLDVESDEPDAGWPPRVTVGDATVFVIVVPARPLLSASTSGKKRTKSKKVTRVDLVNATE